jgi:hypothetical protein
MFMNMKAGRLKLRAANRSAKGEQMLCSCLVTSILHYSASALPPGAIILQALEKGKFVALCTN